MDTNSVMELSEVERHARQLRLLNEIQVENQVGGLEWEEGSDHYFWSDSMFILCGLPVNPNYIIPMEEVDKLIHTGDRAAFRKHREVLQQTGFSDLYLRITTPEGNIKRLHVSERKVQPNGVVVYRGNWRDERFEKNIRQPLKEQHEKLLLQLKIFERAEEVAQTGSWQINLETFETIYSDNVYRIHGLAPQILSPHVDTFRKYIHPEDRAIVLRTQEISYVEMIPLHLEYRIIREDGETRYISQVSHLLKGEKGEHILSGNTRDITEQKLLEIQLREANDILTLQNELFMHAEKIGGVGTWQVNMDTRKTIYSVNLYRIYGLKPQAVQPGLDNFIHYIHPDDQARVRTAYTKAFEEHIAPEISFRITRADGRQRTLLQESRYIKTSEGELMIGVVHDVTERQEQEKQLKEINAKLAVQNESFRQAEKVAAIGSWTWNLATNEIIYSDNIYSIYGLKPHSIPPGFEHFGRYMHPDDRERMKTIPQKLQSEAEPVTIEYRIIRPDGELRYLRSRNHPITNAEEQTIIIGTTQDITDEVNMHQQLLDKIRFAEVLGNSIPDRLIVTDTANNIISWNASCETMYKLKRNEVLGRNFFDVLPQAKVPEVLERFKRSLNGETIHVPVMAILQFPGYQELLMVPIKDEEGRVIAVLHMLHDITHQQQMQQQLAERLQFIEKLQEVSIDRIMVLDADLYFQLWNKQCENYYGLPKEQVIGKNIVEVFPKFKIDPLYRHCLRALEGETVYVPSNEEAGLAGYQESYLIPLKSEVNDITGLLWIMHDLTERFVAESTIRKSEALFRQAEKIAQIGSWEFDINADTLFWSDGIFEIYGYERQSFTPSLKFFLSTLHAHDRLKLEKAIEDVRLQKKELSLLLRAVSLDGRLLYLQVAARAVVNAGGHVTGIIGTALDMTEQQQTLEQVKRSANLMRSQFYLDRQAESLRKVGTWQYNLDSKKMIWGENLYRLLGYAPSKVQPDFEKFIHAVHPDDQAIVRDTFDRFMDTSDGVLPFFEYRIADPDQEVRYLRSTCKIYTAYEGRVMIGSIQDVTEDVLLRKQLLETKQELETLNRSLQHNNRELQQMNEELSSFAFVASHDLREPLRKVQMFSNLILEKDEANLSEKSRDYFYRMVSAVKRMDLLIDDILNFSRINSSKGESAEIDLNQLLKTVRTDMSNVISTTRADIQAEKLPIIRGNHSHFYVLFQNLLSNAMKYQQPGQIPIVKISADVVPGSGIDLSGIMNDVNYYRIRVSDNGIGFDEQFAKKIFQMFQLHEYPGTGMGLAICKKVVEHHDGFIIAHSKPGEGASFDCFFPVPSNKTKLMQDQQ